MRNFRILFVHELLILAIAAPTYVVAALFLALTGFLYWLALYQASVGAAGDLTPVQAWLNIFWVPLLIIVPLVTMRSLAGESRAGTLGALFSTPVRPFQVVLAKFSAAYVLYVLLWALALFFPIITWWVLGVPYNDPRLLALPSILGGAVFIAASGTLYVAVGLLASSLTRSVLVSALLTIAVLLVLLSLGSLLQLIQPELHHPWATALCSHADYLDTFKHLELFLRGVVDTRPLFLFTSGALLALGLTSLSVSAKA
jgi:ABC-2 type transport system permease protein